MAERGMTPGSKVQCASHAPAGWDDFVRAHPDGTYCHLSGWSTVFAEAFGHPTLFLWAASDTGMAAVLPVVRMPTLSGGTVLVSVPYVNYGGPIGAPEACGDLVDEVIRLARGSSARWLELRNRNALADDGPLAPAREKVTVLMDLPTDAEVLMTEHFRAKLRSQIRRPQKEGMEARFGEDQIDDFYSVFSRNMRDLGTPVLPVRFFRSMARVFGPDVTFGVVRHEGRPVAAGCGLHFGDEFEMTWASSLREYTRMAPNMLLYWSFMEHSIGLGRRRFNFGRCTPGGGTHRFKLQWGSSDHPLGWTRWPAEGAPPEPESAAFQRASAIWRRLPLAVANRLGPALTRRIPTF